MIVSPQPCPIPPSLSAFRRPVRSVGVRGLFAFSRTSTATRSCCTGTAPAVTMNGRCAAEKKNLPKNQPEGFARIDLWPRVFQTHQPACIGIHAATSAASYTPVMLSRHRGWPKAGCRSRNQKSRKNAAISARSAVPTGMPSVADHGCHPSTGRFIAMERCTD